MSSTIRQTLPYDPHLDGLRGLAVLFVVLFHAFPDDVPGGWIGVDVFFVLSGFLITSLIAAECDAGRFRYGAFLLRRVRRLAPAFLLVAAASLLFAWQGLFARDLVRAAEAAGAALALCANWYFYANSGYFDADAQTNLFLHTWSLSIEEQFYLVYPLVLIGLPTARRRLGVSILFGAAVLAAFWTAWASSPDQTFFATQARIWELLAGAMVAVWGGRADGWTVRSRRAAKGVTYAAFLALVICAFAVSEDAALPASLIPVVAATAVLLKLPRTLETSRLTRLLSSRPPVSLGKISYALYLWHWPVLAGIRHAIPAAGDGIIASGVLLSVLLAIATYVLVEQPVRTGRALTGRAPLLGSAGLAVLCVAVASATIILGKGFPDRIPQAARAYLAAPEDLDAVGQRCVSLRGLLNDDAVPEDAGKICRAGDEAPTLDGPIDILLWGDSHAGAIRPGFNAEAQARQLRTLVAAEAGCPPAAGLVWRNMPRADALACEARNEAIMRLIERAEIGAVLMVGHWDIYAGADGEGGQSLATNGPFAPVGVSGRGVPAVRASLLATADRLADHAELRLMIDVPSQPTSVPEALAAQARWPWVPQPPFATRKTAIRARRGFAPIADALTDRGQVTVIDPLDALCPPRETQCVVAADGRPLYFDQDHLTSTGSRYLLERVPALMATGDDPS